MQIELNDDEALVLFDLLADYGDTGDERVLAVRHAAERNVLWALLGSLEKALVAPFQPDYPQQLQRARQRIEERGGGWE